MSQAGSTGPRPSLTRRMVVVVVVMVDLVVGMGVGSCCCR